MNRPFSLPVCGNVPFSYDDWPEVGIIELLVPLVETDGFKLELIVLEGVPGITGYGVEELGVSSALSVPGISG